MNYTNLGVEIVDSKADVDEDFPYKIVDKLLAVLFFYVSRQVAMLAVLHNNVNLSVINE